MIHDEALALLAGWTPTSPHDKELRDRYVAHLRSHPDGLLKACFPDHLTAGAIVVSRAGDAVLLNHHRKADAWLAFGGHIEPGDATLADAARRELVGASGRAVMTAKEAIVMGVLVGRDDVVSRAEFEAALWTGQWRGTPKAVDMHIAKLRPKLRVATGGQWQIETVRGAGFVLTRREGEALVSVGVGLAHPATPA